MIVALNWNNRESQIRFFIRNGGVSKARNTGKHNAQGKWIAFVDSDDLIADNYVELLLNTAQKYDSKIAVCGYKKVTDERGIKLDTNYKDELVSGADVWRKVNTGYTTNKLYHFDVVSKIDFDETKQLAEDYLFVNQIFEIYPKAAIIDTILYWYIVNPYSATSLMSSAKCKQALDVYSYGLKISYIVDNKDLLCARKRGLLVWYIRYLEAVVAEQGFNGRKEYRRIKLEIKRVLRDIGTIRKCALYEKILLFAITKTPDFMGLILLEVFHRVRIIRLNYRRKQD
jgi:glycosyltransferase involved in cell wall biosynthesis